MPSSITNYTGADSTLQFHSTPKFLSIYSHLGSHFISHGLERRVCPALGSAP